MRPRGTRLVFATVGQPARWTPMSIPSGRFHEFLKGRTLMSKNRRLSAVGRPHINASTRDHFPRLIEPTGHRAFQFPQYFHGPL